jgi:hypothetical protein
MKASEPKPGEILSKWEGHPGLSLNDDKVRTGRQRVIAAMQEYADLYHKEKLRDIFDKINCLTGYLERWLNNPLSVPPFELKDVINESKEWINEYLKTKE